MCRSWKVSSGAKTEEGCFKLARPRERGTTFEGWKRGNLCIHRRRSIASESGGGRWEQDGKENSSREPLKRGIHRVKAYRGTNRLIPGISRNVHQVVKNAQGKPGKGPGDVSDIAGKQRCISGEDQRAHTSARSVLSLTLLSLTPCPNWGYPIKKTFSPSRNAAWSPITPRKGCRRIHTVRNPGLLRPCVEAL